MKMTLKKIAKPYIDQYKRSPVWVKIVSFVIIIYIATPIDPFDILFPWMALSDDIFLAGVLLKLLNKYGSLPEEDKTTPRDIIRRIREDRKSQGIKEVL
jgi:uncharacterized membrane protein YkvA (DUF1232 family)